MKLRARSYWDAHNKPWSHEPSRRALWNVNALGLRLCAQKCLGRLAVPAGVLVRTRGEVNRYKHLRASLEMH